MVYGIGFTTLPNHLLKAIAIRCFHVICTGQSFECSLHLTSWSVLSTHLIRDLGVAEQNDVDI